ncbi:head GIN domain-containing protein [Marinilabilia sp.]
MLRRLFILTILIIPIGMTGCVYENNGNSYKRSEASSESRSVEDFSAIELEGKYIVRLENSDTCSLDIAAEDELKSLIISEVRNGVLRVRTLEEESWGRFDTPELTIKAPDIKSIEVRVSAKIYSEKPLKFDKLRIESAGALKMDIELEGDVLEADLAGASDLDLRGIVKTVRLNLPGAGKISAYELKTENFDLDLSGAGKARVYASQQLNVDLSGACSVSYKGNPEEVFTNISGIGRVKEAD